MKAIKNEVELAHMEEVYLKAVSYTHLEGKAGRFLWQFCEGRGSLR